MIRFSPYAATLKHNAWFEGRTTGAHRYESNNQAVANPEIQLIVLCDERTFSAAHDLAIRIHDGHLGQVVGREPRNAPTRYIDSLSFTLPNTIFGGGVSYKYSIRPNPYLDEIGEGVVDILIPHGEDELTYALELFSER